MGDHDGGEDREPLEERSRPSAAMGDVAPVWFRWRKWFSAPVACSHDLHTSDAPDRLTRRSILVQVAEEASARADRVPAIAPGMVHT
jgi:hypothetical protein